MRAAALVAAIVLGAGPAAAAAELPDPHGLPELPGPGSSSSASAAGVSVADNTFQPAELRVDPGTAVTWTHTGRNPHTVTADDGSFDSHANCPPVCMQSGQTYERTFDRAGRYPYYCKIHGGPGAGMAGVIIVAEPRRAAATTPAPAPAQDVRRTTANIASTTRAEPPGDPLARTGGGSAAGIIVMLVAACARRLSRS